MAIDTAEKRRAAAKVGRKFLAPGVTPNVAKDQEWRREVGWGYPGIIVSPFVGVKELVSLGDERRVAGLEDLRTIDSLEDQRRVTRFG